MINLIIVAPSDETIQHVTSSFILVDEVYQEAGLKDDMSLSQTTTGNLTRTLGYLLRRYPHRIKFQWIEPMSLKGLFTKFKYHLRSYPVILVISGEEIRILYEEDMSNMNEQVEELLAMPPNNN